MLACAKRFSTVLALLSVSLPASAQHITPPDCTVDVAVSAGPILEVTYRCRSMGPIAFVADDATVAAHVQDMQDGAGAKIAASNEGWVVQPENGLAEARYHYDLADYAQGVNSTASAVLRGQGVLVSLAGWLLAPRGYDDFPIIDIRARTAEGLSFAAGLPRVSGAWRLAGAAVGYAGYTAIGKFSLQEFRVPAPGSLRPGQPKKDVVLRLAILDGISDSGRVEITDWVKRTAEAEANYWHGFTAPHLLLGLVPTPSRRGVGYGQTDASGGATVMVEVDAQVGPRPLFDDWVLVHELIHTAMPFVRGRATWLMEGAATYVEPIIRARAGWKTEEAVWKEWVDDMPQGMGAYAKGLSNASGRENYWSGALFMLMADLGIRRDTNGEKGLEDCLAGYQSSPSMSLGDYVTACDRMTGTKVMSGLAGKYYATGQQFDLPGFWRDIGVSEVGDQIVLNDSAPMAQWRKMIVMGPPGDPPKAVKLPWQP